MLRTKAGRVRSLLLAVVLTPVPAVWLTIPEAHAQPVDRYLLELALGCARVQYRARRDGQPRLRPEYEAPGVQVGVHCPPASQKVGYNDNVLGTRKGSGSFDLDSQASVAVNSNWGRNSLGGLVSVDDQRLPGQSTQNRTNWTTSLGGTYEFGGDVLAVGYTSHCHAPAPDRPSELPDSTSPCPLPSITFISAILHHLHGSR